jgi:hypothetical protein
MIGNTQAKPRSIRLFFIILLIGYTYFFEFYPYSFGVSIIMGTAGFCNASLITDIKSLPVRFLFSFASFTCLHLIGSIQSGKGSSSSVVPNNYSSSQSSPDSIKDNMTKTNNIK